MPDPAEIAGYAIYCEFRRVRKSGITRYDRWDSMPRALRDAYIAEGRAAVTALRTAGFLCDNVQNRLDRMSTRYR